ncbi:hypothetical protein [Paraglaciecola psychrophila]|uniref:Uncharacterized protein n=1 Tax=Paraglaciecola psychrophila 170 TaxID=1129794 RepID=K6ZNK2_9ALTE|nr:hypothetical protein [Paraglaciecola psychrophila]AGH45848.1 hypothetical protein C427_3740 [Paraglaciecola psychrophila 170]GAC37531.1 hypothetical protein GPSY_1907 [Paraglaciecola psychrophila 170]
MHKALHPQHSNPTYKNQLIDCSEFKKLATQLGFQDMNLSPSTQCPVCNRDMKVKAGHTKANAHFYHNDSQFCPTKDPAARPYRGLTPTRPDPQTVEQNRNFADLNMDKLWARTKDIVPFLDLKEFLKLLKEANRLNVYSYANLKPQYLPYVYVTLLNFLPSQSYKKRRKLKFCFFYEDSVKSYDDLWINAGQFSRLTRISYDKTKTKAVRIIDTSTNYLNTNTSLLSEAQLVWCRCVM